MGADVVNDPADGSLLFGKASGISCPYGTPEQY